MISGSTICKITAQDLLDPSRHTLVWYGTIDDLGEIYPAREAFIPYLGNEYSFERETDTGWVTTPDLRSELVLV